MITQGEIDAAPKVKLGGKEWPVPLLVPRQQRVCVPGVLHLMPMLATPTALKAMSEGDYDLMVRVIVTALQRGTPSVTIDQFYDDFEVTLKEMSDAIAVIARQSGLLKPKEDGEPASGEAEAVSPSTGTS